MKPRCKLAMAMLLALAIAAAAIPAWAQPGAESRRDPPKAEASPSEKIAIKQQEIADKFKRFEQLLFRMAELSAATDPNRAALLRKAAQQSKEHLLDTQFETLVSLLQKDQLSRAMENQGAVDQDLRAILELLMSENRSKRLESEKARLREYIAKLNAIINQQKGVQGRTAGGAEPAPLATEQEKVASKTDRLAQDIRNNEEKDKDKNAKGQGDSKSDAKADKSDGKDGKGDKGDKSDGKDTKDRKDGKGEKSDGKDSKGDKADGKSGKGEKSDGKGDKSDGKSGKGGKSKDGSKPSEGSQGSQGQGQESEQKDSKSDGAHPARKRLEAAQQRMREAQEKLKEAKRDGALEKQEQALRELEQAKAELEKILRQLREEEIQRSLVALEARFAKMLQMQKVVYDETLRLDKTPAQERDHRHEVEAGRLSGKEAEIDIEAGKALLLLREDGTAVALPEAVSQMRQDIQQVVRRLSEAKVEKITQGIEEDIIKALEEIIAAIKKAIKEMEEQKNQGQMQQGDQQDPPLVDILAELKMIRALQMRVNSRTQRYSKLIEGEQAQNADLVEALHRLSEWQQRIYKITRDLELGKNR